MTNNDKYNSEGYLDMTSYLAMKNIENSERRTHMRDDWVYRRGDIYFANLDPYIGSEQGGTRPVVVLQNNVGNYFAPTLVIAPITSRSYKARHMPTHYTAERVRGLDGAAVVLLEQIKTIDKRRVLKYLGKMSHRQMEEIGDVIETSLGLHIPEEMEAP